MILKLCKSFKIEIKSYEITGHPIVLTISFNEVETFLFFRELNYLFFESYFKKSTNSSYTR